ncbi:MAG: class II fructose-bisphosphate aldolase [Bacteroidales bacterium]
MVLLQEKLAQLRKAGKAILAANFYNLETLQGVLRSASALNAPIILQLSEGSIHYIGLKTAAQMAFSALKEFNVEGWLHLDHGASYELAAKCLDEGFNSVMIDASEKPFGENVKITKEVVKLAEKYKANVEAELGFVAKLGQSNEGRGFTQPDEAFEFVNATGVHALAVAIGSAHGFYKQTPKLEIELLSKISRKVQIPLVLHGASGIPDEMLREAIKNGITKINLATETKNTFMKELKNLLLNTDEIDLRKVFPKAIDAVTTLITNKIKVISL